MTRASLAGALALGAALVLASPCPALADSDDDASVEDRRRIPMDERREVPDYDGREAAPPTAGERALWVPRVLLAPVWVVNEFVLRRPLEAIVLAAEQGEALEKIAYVLTFGTGGRVGLVPTALIDFGFRPSVGLYLWANDTPTEGDRLRVSGAYGGSDWWQFRLTERIAIGDAAGAGNQRFEYRHLMLEFAYEQRPDHLAYGLGALRDPEPLAIAYEQKHLYGAGGLEWRFGELDGFELHIEGGRRRFENGDRRVERADIGLREVGNSGSTLELLTRPDATGTPLTTFTDYRYVATTVRVSLDSRDNDVTTPGDGARIELGTRLSHGTFVRPTERRLAEASTLLDDELAGDRFVIARPYVHAGLFWDVNDYRRVLSLVQTLEWAETLSGRPVPWAELPSLGGGAPMRGFVPGRMRGRSTMTTTLAYQYPIWVSLDAFLFAGAGQAFGERFDGATPGGLAGNFGFGVRSATDRDAAFELLVGAGTTRLDSDRFGVESVRFLIGATRGL